MKASTTYQWITQHLEKALSSVAKPNEPFARLRKINHLSISHLRTPFIILLAILNSITFIFPQTCVSVTFLGCKYMQSDTSDSLFYFEFGDCFLCQAPPPPLVLSPLQDKTEYCMYITTHPLFSDSGIRKGDSSAKNRSCQLQLRGRYLSIRSYQYKPSIPHFKKTVGIIVTTIGRSDFWDYLGGQA